MAEDNSLSLSLSRVVAEMCDEDAAYFYTLGWPLFRAAVQRQECARSRGRKQGAEMKRSRTAADFG